MLNNSKIISEEMTSMTTMTTMTYRLAVGWRIFTESVRCCFVDAFDMLAELGINLEKISKCELVERIDVSWKVNEKKSFAKHFRSTSYGTMTLKKEDVVPILTCMKNCKRCSSDNISTKIHRLRLEFFDGSSTCIYISDDGEYLEHLIPGSHYYKWYYLPGKAVGEMIKNL